MANETRDPLVYARLVDLHRRKIEAEMVGRSTAIHEALLELYRLELVEIEAAKRLPLTFSGGRTTSNRASCGFTKE